MQINIKKYIQALSITLLTISIQSIAATTTQDTKSCKTLGLNQCPEPFDQTIPEAAEMLTWDQQQRIIGFRNTYRMYLGDVFTPNNKAIPLPQAPYPLPELQYSIQNKKYTLSDYLKHQDVTGLLIIKNGAIVYEYYAQGNTPTTLWTSRSVAKSVVSILIGIALKEGTIQSIEDPIINYIPELKGTAWEKVTLHQLLQHTSGTNWNEDYKDPNSDFAHMTLCESTNQPYECILERVKSRPQTFEPGQAWSYNTGGAWLVGLLLERATKMTIAQYLETRLWNQYPMEQQGVWHALEKNKTDMGGHGFNATLRDWGRFGLFVSNQGKLPNGNKLLPNDWIKQSTTWTTAKGSIDKANPKGQYGYQWWRSGITPDTQIEPKTTRTSEQTFWAMGIFGQAIAINPAEDLVMVQWSTWKDADPSNNLLNEQAAFFNAVSKALEKK